MTETYISSSGEFKQYLDGNLVDNIEFTADYDGEILDAELSLNDQKYYTQLDNETLMELLNYPKSNESLIVRLQQEFPLKKTVVTKTKKRKKGSAKKSKK